MRFIRKHQTLCSFIAAIIPAGIAAWPLFGARFIPTHDGEYHIIRFWQFYKMLSYGVLFPRWAPDLNNGFGIPLFTFHYPFPNYIGSAFHFFGLSFVDSVKWTVAAGYILAQGFAYLWLHKMYGRVPAVIGVIAGSYVPYWFIDLYVRGSVGEVWALAWVFGALAAVAYAKRLLVTIAIALLILSHNILALIFVPLLFLYILVAKAELFPAGLLGIGAAAYFWIPALFEQRFMVGVSPVNIFDHFPAVHQLLIPSWGTGFRGAVGGGNEMSYQIGLIPFLLLFYLTCTCIVNKNGKRVEGVHFFLAVGWIAIALMLPWSQFLWRAIPLAHVIQYPWRLLSIIVVVAPVLSAFVARQFRYGWLVAVLAVLLSFGYSRPVTYAPRTDEGYLSRDDFVKGTSSLGNALQTIWMSGAGSGHAGASGVTVPIAYYPGWYARIDGTITQVYPGDGGLVSVPVSAGEHEFEVALGDTWWQRAAAFVSVISLSAAVLSFILWGGVYHAHRNQHTAPYYRTPHARNRRVHAESD